MDRRTLTTILLTVLVLVLLIVGVGLLYLYSGEYNVAATDPHVGIVSWALETGQVQSVKSHAEELEITLPTDSAALSTGYTHFSSMCVPCHGAPGVDRGEYGEGLNPKPPALSEVVPIYRPEEVYWILEHGIKMTGMPAFGPTHSEEALRAITAFVLQLPEMTPEEYQAWGERSTGGHAHEHGEQAPQQGGHAHTGDGHEHTH